MFTARALYSVSGYTLAAVALFALAAGVAWFSERQVAPLLVNHSRLLLQRQCPECPSLLKLDPVEDHFKAIRFSMATPPTDVKDWTTSTTFLVRKDVPNPQRYYEVCTGSRWEKLPVETEDARPEDYPGGYGGKICNGAGFGYAL